MASSVTGIDFSRISVTVGGIVGCSLVFTVTVEDVMVVAVEMAEAFDELLRVCRCGGNGGMMSNEAGRDVGSCGRETAVDAVDDVRRLVR
jgi:hypothetical protein